MYTVRVSVVCEDQPEAPHEIQTPEGWRDGAVQVHRVRVRNQVEAAAELAYEVQAWQGGRRAAA